MNNNNKNPLIIAYYLSKFDKLALQNLGYSNFTEAFEKISKIIDANPANIKNMRDEFDPIHDNKRVGWHQKKMTKSRRDIVDEYSNYTEEELRKIVLDILSKNNANQMGKEENSKNQNDEYINENIESSEEKSIEKGEIIIEDLESVKKSL